MNTPFFATVRAIIRKDLQAEFRSRELVGTMLMFALLSILVFSFALELDRIAREEAISGVLWVTLIFASVLGLNRSMALERDNANIDALLLAPIHRSAIFAGKLIGNLIFTLAMSIVLLPVMTILYNITLLTGWLIITLLLGVFGFAVTGTLLAAMTVQTRAREALLPITLLPVALPLIMAAVRATTGIISDADVAAWQGWLAILALIDLVYLVICAFSFEFVVED
jgi:heme exporter protein B